MQRLYPTSKAHGPPEDIYDDLQFPDPPGDRPYVALNMVSTVDGKTTLDLGLVPGPIGSPIDRTLMARLRIPVDAVVRGAATVRRSPYYPGIPAEREHLRIDRGLERQPLAVVITASGDLPLDAPFFQAAPRRPLVIAPEDTNPALLAEIQVVADTLLVGRKDVDLTGALQRLRSKYGILRLLSEGGPRINYKFLQAGLLDELFWTVAPILGGKAADLSMVHGPHLLDPMPMLELASAYADNHELFLRYRVQPARDGVPMARTACRAKGDELIE